MLQIPDTKLKEMLVRDGVMTSEDFEAAVADAQRRGQSTTNLLLSRNRISAEYLNRLLTEYFGVEPAKLATRKIDEEAIKLLPEDLARQKRAIVFAREADGSLAVAMEDPSDLAIIDFLQRYLKAKIKPFLASQEDLNLGFVYYGRKLAQDFKTIIEENIKTSLQTKIFGKEEKEAAQELPVVAIVDNLLAYSLASRASDIHIEILEDSVLIRHRIDGMLQEVTRVPKEVHPSIVARLKLLAGLKLDEHAKPQDGRFRYQSGKDIMDIRVAVMPTFYGEKVVLRLLSASQRVPSLEELGFEPDTKEIFIRNIKRTFGMVLVTGPTGSGKTTTLYSALNILNNPEVNIMTVEDPIEYEIKYVNQTQINPQAGITFASALRAILRQDPNIILVGEIRDSETAEIAIHAALTGHLLLSTLHTNDAITAIPRLIDMNIPPFLVAAVLNAVLAQRLVRRLCPDCREPYKLDIETAKGIQRQCDELKLKVKCELPEKLYKAKGCASCNLVGYKGRLAILEIFEVTEDIRSAIIRPDFSLDVLRETARRQGMISMFEDGLRKAEKGLTTIEEVLRVIGE